MENTRERVTICTIHCPMASFPYCRKTKEIYDRKTFGRPAMEGPEKVILLCQILAFFQF